MTKQVGARNQRLLTAFWRPERQKAAGGRQQTCRSSARWLLLLLLLTASPWLARTESSSCAFSFLVAALPAAPPVPGAAPYQRHVHVVERPIGAAEPTEDRRDDFGFFTRDETSGFSANLGIWGARNAVPHRSVIIKDNRSAQHAVISSVHFFLL